MGVGDQIRPLTAQSRSRRFFSKICPLLLAINARSMKKLVTLFTTSLEPAAAAAEALTLRGFPRGNPSAGWPPDSNAAQRHVAK